MVFSSLEFLCVFLPVVFVLYSVIPSLVAKNALLILASLAFYAYGEPIYILLMLGSVAVNYIIAMLIDGAKSGKKVFLAIGVILNLAALGTFKYADFFVTNINKIPGIDIPSPNISLPIGISFFTFQAMSYVIDVYRGHAKVQKNPFYVLLYISFFPQLIAGPIVKYKDIHEQINDRKQEANEVAYGLQRFIFGLGKKVLIANTMGQVADNVFSTSAGNLNIALAWLGAITYMLQIFFDFSGYSDMAIGLGHMFGFKFKENFIYPYGAASIKEFWRRWHISLSTWFKEYLYIPLGGNRKGAARTYLNKIIVFLTTGLWHGASWTFVIWGLWHGLFLILEDIVPWKGKVPKFFTRIYTLLVVCLGFVMFRADTLADGATMISQMFTGFTFTTAGSALFLAQLTPWFIAMAVVGVLLAAPLRCVLEKIRVAAREENKAGANAFLLIISLTILCWCILRLSGSTYNPFIYFRF